MNYSFDFSVLIKFIPSLAYGFLTTLQVAVLAIVTGAVLGFLLGYARTYASRPAAIVATVIVEFVRGVPVLIQLFWLFFCLPPILGFEVSAFVSAYLALALFMAAISCESFRSSFATIDREQWDASVALAIPRHVMMTYVVLPQAVLRAAPTLLSNAVTVFKESAIISAVGMADLMFVGRNISSATGHPIEVLTVVAAIYFVVAYPLAQIVSAIERRVLDRLAL